MEYDYAALAATSEKLSNSFSFFRKSKFVLICVPSSTMQLLSINNYDRLLFLHTC